MLTQVLQCFKAFLSTNKFQSLTCNSIAIEMICNCHPNFLPNVRCIIESISPENLPNMADWRNKTTALSGTHTGSPTYASVKDCKLWYCRVVSHYNNVIFSSKSVSLTHWQNGRHFPDNIFKCIFLNENIWIPINISLKFVPKGLIKNIPALVQIMAWRRPGNKPLSEPMMVSLLTHIWVTQPHLNISKGC